MVNSFEHGEKWCRNIENNNFEYRIWATPAFGFDVRHCFSTVNAQFTKKSSKTNSRMTKPIFQARDWGSIIRLKSIFPPSPASIFKLDIRLSTFHDILLPHLKNAFIASKPIHSHANFWRRSHSREISSKFIHLVFIHSESRVHLLWVRVVCYYWCAITYVSMFLNWIL